MSDIYQGGMMTDLPAFAGTAFDGTELMEIVSPGVLTGINYRITTAQLAALIPGYTYTNTIITSGATPVSPYAVLTTDRNVLFNKTVGAASGALLGLAASQPLPVLVKDLKGDAATNNITVTFTGGETCDGLSQVVIDSNYGWFVLNPLATGNYYLSGG